MNGDCYNEYAIGEHNGYIKAFNIIINKLVDYRNALDDKAYEAAYVDVTINTCIEIVKDALIQAERDKYVS